MGRVVLHPQLIVTDYSEANALVGYYAQYYLAYLHYLQGQMTATDSNTIAELAQRCPAKDGVVVYKARALQQRLNWTTVFYHDEGCDQSNALYRRVQQPILNADAAAPTVYMLYPNPNKGSFVLAKKEANMPSDHKSVYLKVYNALGVLVYQKEASFVNEQIQLDLPQKTQGVYLLCIGDQQERSTCLRFVLQ